jgi:hypothetical protein
VAAQDRPDPRTVYLYLVCLAMVVVGVLAAVQLVRSTMAIVYPDVTPSFTWTAYTPLEEVSGEQRGGGEQFLSEEQLAQVAKESRRPAIRDAVTAGTALLLAGVVFALHCAGCSGSGRSPPPPLGCRPLPRPPDRRGLRREQRAG